MRVNRDSPVPFYEQVTEVLRAEINAGTLPAGRQTIRSLARRYGCSAGTVSCAVSILHRSGMIEYGVGLIFVPAGQRR